MSQAPGISKGNPNAWGRDEGSVSFLSTLSPGTLAKARESVKVMLIRESGGILPTWVTDRELDRIVEAFGPRAMEHAHRLADDEKIMRRLRARGFEMPHIAMSKRPAVEANEDDVVVSRSGKKTVDLARSRSRLISLSTNVQAALKDRG